MQEELKKMVDDNLNHILESVILINAETDQEDINSIDFLTLKTIIDKSKPKKTKDKSINDFIDKYNNTLDVLYRSCRTKCDSLGEEMCRIEILTEGVLTIKYNIGI